MNRKQEPIDGGDVTYVSGRRLARCKRTRLVTGRRVKARLQKFLLHGIRTRARQLHALLALVFGRALVFGWALVAMLRLLAPDNRPLQRRPFDQRSRFGQHVWTLLVQNTLLVVQRGALPGRSKACAWIGGRVVSTRRRIFGGRSGRNRRLQVDKLRVHGTRGHDLA